MHIQNLLIFQLKKSIKRSFYGKVNSTQFHVLLYRAEIIVGIIGMKLMYLFFVIQSYHRLEVYIPMSYTFNQFQNLSMVNLFKSFTTPEETQGPILN